MDLSQWVLEDAERELCAVAETCLRLRVLDCSHQAELSVRPLVAFANALRRRHGKDGAPLRHLCLSYSALRCKQHEFEAALCILVVSVSRSLVSLEVRGTKVGDKALTIIAARCLRLRHLDISGCANVTDAGIAALVKGECHRTLKHVAAQGCAKVQAQWFLQSMKSSALLHHAALVCVDLSYCRCVTDPALSVLVVTCASSLETLLLQGCAKVTDVTGKLVFAKLRRLQKVSFAGCRNISDITVSSACSSHALIHADFRRTRASSKGVSQLLLSLAQLEELLVEADPLLQSAVKSRPRPWKAVPKPCETLSFERGEEEEEATSSLANWQMSTLKLCGISLSRRLLHQVLQNSPKLMSLDLCDSTEAVTTTLLKAALERCRCLRELCIASWAGLTDDAVMTLRSASTLHCLRLLDISRSSHTADLLSSDALLELLDACNQLLELRIRHRSGFNAACTSALSVELQVLLADGCHHLCIQGLRTAVSRCNNLRSIHLSHCPQLLHQDLSSLHPFVIKADPDLTLYKPPSPPPILQLVSQRMHREDSCARTLQRAWRHRPPLTREQRLVIARAVVIIQRAARAALLRLRLRRSAATLRSIRLIQGAVRLWRLNLWLTNLEAGTCGGVSQAALVLSAAMKRFLWRLSAEGRRARVLCRRAKEELQHLKQRSNFQQIFSSQILPSIAPTVISSRRLKHSFVVREPRRTSPLDHQGLPMMQRVLKKDRALILARNRVLVQIVAEGDRRRAARKATKQRRSAHRMMLLSCSITMLQRVYRRRKRKRLATLAPAERSFHEPWRIVAWTALQAAVRGYAARQMVARVRAVFPGERVVISAKAEVMRMAAREALQEFLCSRLGAAAKQLAGLVAAARERVDMRTARLESSVSSVARTLKDTRRRLERKCKELAAAQQDVEADACDRRVEDLHQARLHHVTLDRSAQELSTVRMLEAMVRAFSGEQEKARHAKRGAGRRAYSTRARTLRKAQQLLVETRGELEKRKTLLRTNDKEQTKKRYSESSCAMLRRLSSDEAVEEVRALELAWVEERLRDEVVPALEASLRVSVDLGRYGLGQEAVEEEWCDTKERMVSCLTAELPKLKAVSAELMGLLRDKCGIALKLDLAQDSAKVDALSKQLHLSITQEVSLQDKLNNSFRVISAAFERMRSAKRVSDSARDNGILSNPQGTFTCVLPPSLRSSHSATSVASAVAENAWTALIPPRIYTNKTWAQSTQQQADRAEKAVALAAAEDLEKEPARLEPVREPVRAVEPAQERTKIALLRPEKRSWGARYKEWRNKDAIETALMKRCILNRQKLRTGLGEGILDILITVGEEEAERMARTQQDNADRGAQVFTRIARNLGLHESIYLWVTKTLLPERMITDVRLIQTSNPNKEAFTLADNGYRKVSHHKLQGPLRNRFELWVSTSTQHEQIVDLKVSYDPIHERIFKDEGFKRLVAKRPSALLIPKSKIWVKRGIQPAKAVDITNLEKRRDGLEAATEEHPDSADIRELLRRCEVQLEEARAELAASTQDPLTVATELMALLPSEMNAFVKLFMRMDYDRSGDVSMEEFMSFANISNVELASKVFHFLDGSGDGILSFPEFLLSIGRICLFGAVELVQMTYSFMAVNHNGLVDTPQGNVFSAMSYSR